MLKLLLSFVFFTCLGTAQIITAPQGSSGGAGGVAPYVVPAFTGSPQTISAGTHGQGVGATALCADSATPPNITTCGVSNSSPSTSGNIILTYTATPSFALIYTPGGSGVAGPTGATGTGCGTLGGDLSGTCAAATVAKVNGAAFAGANGDLVSFGASNVPTDSGILATSLAPKASPTFTGTVTQPSFNSTTNCSSSASPAVCTSAAAGSIAFPTGVTSVALQVNTTAVTANSQIFVFPDDTLGTRLGVTCNSTLATLVGGMAITARSAGASFTVTYNGTIATNPLCANFIVVN